MIKNDKIDLIINTPSGKTPRKDEVKIRSTAVERRIPILTTISGVEASIRAMRSIQTKGLTVRPSRSIILIPDSEPESRLRKIDLSHAKFSTTPMHSMTGYGRGQAMSQGTRVIAEIQSVNKRQTEILVNLPAALASLESDLRAKIDRSLHRGRIIVTISASGPAAHHQPVIDSDLANLYLAKFKQLQKELALAWRDNDRNYSAIARSCLCF